ncbi:hypothetical protein [Thermoflavimicrobium daqui]|uniref:hypothetical protein n=1 Tax=Thermoflavimicrobium daqui TaxID=2137476 RepID=UPI00143CEFB8|nr:hypothetical protein [Thermoflavimicrobium daqui]
MDLLQVPGDYLYRSGNIRWDVELGLWGIIRVLGEKHDHLAPLLKQSNIEEGDDD